MEPTWHVKVMGNSHFLYRWFLFSCFLQLLTAGTLLAVVSIIAVIAFSLYLSGKVADWNSANVTDNAKKNTDEHNAFIKPLQESLAANKEKTNLIRRLKQQKEKGLVFGKYEIQSDGTSAFKEMDLEEELKTAIANESRYVDEIRIAQGTYLSKHHLFVGDYTHTNSNTFDIVQSAIALVAPFFIFNTPSALAASSTTRCLLFVLFSHLSF